MLFLSPGQDSFQSACRQVLCLYDVLGKPGIPATPKSSRAVGGSKLAFVVFGGQLNSLVLTSRAALKLALNARGNVKVHMETTWLFHEDDEQYVVEDGICEALGFPVRHGKSWEVGLSAMSRCAGQWAATGVHVCVLASLPVGASSKSTSACAGAPLSLHSGSSRLFWTLLAGLRSCCDAHPMLRMSTFFVSAVGYPEDQEVVMDAAFGARCSADPVKHNSPLSAFHVRTFPAPLSVCGAITPWNPKELSNGMSWCGANTFDKVARGDMARLTPNILNLVDCQVFGDRELTAEEREHMDMILMQPLTGGDKSLLDLSTCLGFAGLHQFDFAAIVEKVFPCHHAIQTATGLPAASPDSPGSTSCGKRRWCSHCEKIARAVFATPHVGLQAEYLLAGLGTVLDAYAADAASLLRPDFSTCEQHVCGPHCDAS